MASRGVAGFDASALRRLRRRRGLSQAALALAARRHGASISGSHVCLYEQGKRVPEMSTAMALAAAMNVEPTRLLDRRVVSEQAWLRLRAGLSQREVAEHLGISQGHWSRIENGEATLEDSKLAAAAGLLCVSTQLLRGLLERATA